MACSPDEEIISGDHNLKLQISADTVLFDTLLSERTSITRRLRIYNFNESAVLLDRIKLGQAENSAYSLVINGQEGKVIEDEILFGGDSMLVLINVSIDPLNTNSPYLVKDSVIVEWNNNQFDVKLIAWGQDANYFRKYEVLCDQVLTAERPYVFTDTTLIGADCEITIEPGARLYFDQSAILFVAGHLNVIGEADQQVVFRNSRFDEDYLRAPGQWKGVYFLEGGTGTFHHAVLENATHAITVGAPDSDTIPEVILTNSIIRHSSKTGIRGFTSDIRATNCLIFDAGEALIYNVAGGSYQYDHCTFANYPRSFISENPSVIFADFYWLANETILTDQLHVSLTNSIIWGENRQELLDTIAFAHGSTSFVFNNIISASTDIGFNETSIADNFPRFIDPFTFQYEIDSISPAIDRSLNKRLEIDLRGKLRDGIPDLGAYEYISN
ncbi:MAG: hypothetical protein JXQ90_14255 [Cyclobacteriaceae bacterium]